MNIHINFIFQKYCDCHYLTVDSIPLIKGDMKNRNICVSIGYQSFIFLILKNIELRHTNMLNIFNVNTAFKVE